MRAIVAQHLPGTDAEIHFRERAAVIMYRLITGPTLERPRS